MPNNDSSSYSAPGVQNRAPKPPGVLPRNAQGWVIGGMALLMVAVIAFSGRNQSKGRNPATPPQIPAAMEPSQARIEEYRARIDEQARKLAAEQAQLAETKRTLGAAPNVPAPAGAGAPYTSPYQGYPREPRKQSWAEMDQQKREHQSLFASNVVLSNRHGAQASSHDAPTAQPTEPPAQVPPQYVYPYLPPALVPAGPPQPGWPLLSLSGRPEQEAAASQRESQENGRSADNAGTAGKGKPQERYKDLNRAEGKEYRLFEGTVIETVLTNRLDGSFSGPVNCMVTTNLYSHDGQRLLIPQGSRVLGEVRKVETFAQQRLAVVFHRIIMPDGYSVSLDKFQGLNQIGETGLVDQIRHHYLQVFGVSLAVGAIAGLGQANTRYGLDASAADAYRQGVATSLSQSSLNILDRYLNVLPTFTIREGHRVKIYLTEDLVLPAYEKHQMPSDL